MIIEVMRLMQFHIRNCFLKNNYQRNVLYSIIAADTAEMNTQYR